MTRKEQSEIKMITDRYGYPWAAEGVRPEAQGGVVA